MERQAELALFLDWLLVNPEFLDGVRLSAPLSRPLISYLFVRLHLKLVETQFYTEMESEKSLKNILPESFWPAFEHDLLDPRCNTPTITQTFLLS